MPDLPLCLLLAERRFHSNDRDIWSENIWKFLARGDLETPGLHGVPVCYLYKTALDVPRFHRINIVPDTYLYLTGAKTFLMHGLVKCSTLAHISSVSRQLFRNRAISLRIPLHFFNRLRSRRPLNPTVTRAQRSIEASDSNESRNRLDRGTRGNQTSAVSSISARTLIRMTLKIQDSSSSLGHPSRVPSCRTEMRDGLRSGDSHRRRTALCVIQARQRRPATTSLPFSSSVARVDVHVVFGPPMHPSRSSEKKTRVCLESGYARLRTKRPRVLSNALRR